MSAAASKEAKPTPAAAAKAPPEEQFWKRYSPHGEAPISAAGSLALHALAFGLLLIIGIYLASLFGDSNRGMPMEAVRLDLPGGGGNPDGKGSGPGGARPQEDLGPKGDKPSPGAEDSAKRPDLNAVEKEKLKLNFDDASTRFLSETKSDTAKAIARMDEKLRDKLRLNETPNEDPGKGKGGTGSGGGEGTGSGKGTGGGTADGKSKLNQREKRMLRWHMNFTANDGPEYLKQLRALGAILAFPVGEGASLSFKVVKKLEPGGPALDEDVRQLNRIYWIDDRQKSVAEIMDALHLTLPTRPPHFAALMPAKLEADLYRMERDYVERQLRRPWKEDSIADTYFEVVNVGGTYRPQIVKVLMYP